jgi:hypothetical protein
MKRRPLAVYITLMAVIIAMGLPARFLDRPLPYFYTQYFGDYLWAMLLFFLFSVIFNLTTKKGIWVTLLFCYFIELTQLCQEPWLNELREYKIIALVIGYGFLWSDIVGYTLGVLTGAWIDRTLRAKLK